MPGRSSPSLSKIEKIVGNSVKIIDSGYAVSKQIKNVLSQNNMLNTQTKQGIYQFYSNMDKIVLENLLSDVDIPIMIKKTVF